MSIILEKVIALENKDILQAIKSSMGSVTFMKRLIPTSVINIIYNRIEYDKSIFREKSFLGEKYMLLTSKAPKNHPASQVTNWLADVVTSLEKRYLKEFYLIIQDKTESVTLETYRFIIKYPNADEASVPQVADWQKASVHFFRDINFLSTFKKNGAECTLQVQCILNDDAPVGYVTPNFKISTPLVSLSENEEYTPLTKISTGYHKLKIYATGIPMEKEIAANVDTTDCSSVKTESNKRKIFCNTPVPFPQRKKKENSTKTSNTDNCASLIWDTATRSGTVSDRDPELTCMCGIKESLPRVHLIQCIECKNRQHNVCSGFESLSDVDIRTYQCYHCCKFLKLKCADERMVQTGDEKNRQFLAVFRLVIIYCKNIENNPMKIIKYLPESERKSIMEKFEKNCMMDSRLVNGKTEYSIKEDMFGALVQLAGFYRNCEQPLSESETMNT